MSSSFIPSNISGLSAPFTGATTGIQGTSGSVPTPAVGNHTRLLRGDATWAGAFSVGSGSPNSVIIGSIGDAYYDSTGLQTYVKTAGNNSNTGWSVEASVFIGKRSLTSGTTYTPTAGTTKIIAYVVGGGGGGGACSSSASTFQGSGGGAGAVVGFVEPVSSSSSYTYSIGSGGASSSVGTQSTITVNGNVYTAGPGNPGTDGTTGAPSTTQGAIGGTTTPGVVSGNAFMIADGGPGSAGFSVASNNHVSGQGGSNMFGAGGRGVATNSASSSAGVAGNGAGAGGSGARQNNSTAVAGGAGQNGMIMILEMGGSSTAGSSTSTLEYASGANAGATFNTSIQTVSTTAQANPQTVVGTANRLNLNSATVLSTINSSNITVGTNTITINKTAVFNIDISITMAQAGRYGIQVTKNGALIAIGAVIGAGAGDNQATSVTILNSITTGDIIDFRVISDTTGTVSVNNFSWSINQIQ